jgi:hypothetical protein
MKNGTALNVNPALVEAIKILKENAGSNGLYCMEDPEDHSLIFKVNLKLIPAVN